MALVSPLAMVTDAGTLTLAALLFSTTANPPLGAAADTDTVQDAVSGVGTGFGLHSSEVKSRDGLMLTVPVVPDTVTALPAGPAPNASTI